MGFWNSGGRDCLEREVLPTGPGKQIKVLHWPWELNRDVVGWVVDYVLELAGLSGRRFY